MSEREKVVVVGLGYVGLPLAVRAVEAGYAAVGLDVAAGRVAELRAGRSYVEDIRPETVADCLRTGRFLPTSDAGEVRGFDIAVITVPTPLTDGSSTTIPPNKPCSMLTFE